MKRKADRPTLYLDFDGVLHPDAVYRVRGKIVLRRDGVSLFEWAPVLDVLIAPYESLQIVLSTSWVRALGYDETLRWLAPTIRRHVVGATWHSHMNQFWWQGLCRFQQIARDAMTNKHVRWLAIDNDGDGWPAAQADRLVLTNDELGLGEPRVQNELEHKLEELLHWH